MNPTKQLVARLGALGPVILDICKVSGTPGASIGILHENEVVYSKSFGYRDVENRIPPDENTIYYLASLSKAFTVAALGISVEEGALSWDTPVANLVPEFHQQSQIVEKKSSILDWLSHRTGLAPKNSIFLGEHGHLLLPRSETMRVVSYLEEVYGFRSRWLYNNWGYALADEVIELVAGQTWGEVLQKGLLDPLGMDRTIMKHDTQLDNVAKGYISLADGSPLFTPRPGFEDGVSMEGAAGVQSSIHDLLVFYKEFIRAGVDQLASGSNSTEGSPFKQVNQMWTGHIPISPESSELERSYGLGWIRTQLPGPLGEVGLNPTLVSKMPLVGKGSSTGPLVLYHHGSTPGFLTSVHIIPETKTAIIVLTNSLANNDAADWLGQLLLEAVINNEDKNDYVNLARISAKNAVDKWSRMAKELAAKRVPGTSVKPLKSYVGSYLNCVGNWNIEIFMEDEELRMCFQGNRKEKYSLKHYNYDVFSWLLSHDQDARRGRFWVTDASFYLINFETSTAGEISQLVWKHDSIVSHGETFIKVNSLNLNTVVIDKPGDAQTHLSI